MSANNYVNVVEAKNDLGDLKYTVAVRDADTGHNATHTTKTFQSLREACIYADSLASEYMVEYGVIFSFLELSNGGDTQKSE